VNRPLRFFQRRIVWHTLGVMVALALAWMIFRAYRQPEFLLPCNRLGHRRRADVGAEGVSEEH